MNETLFSQIQRLLERTYAQVGINLEDCIIDRARSVHLSKLAGASARELNEIARTFLRHAGDQLYVGIYYSRWLIDQLERHDPRSGLSDSNIRSLIVFVEELNHALHAALQFKNGQRRIASEEFARDLELQAQVDTYLVLLLFVAFFRKTQRVSRTDRRWLRFHLFSRQCPDAFRDENLRGRYLETCDLARQHTQGDSLERGGRCNLRMQKSNRCCVTTGSGSQFFIVCSGSALRGVDPTGEGKDRLR